jgi:hypothetical protein
MALTRPKYSQIYDTDWKQSVKVATTGDVGNLISGNVQTNTIDGVTLGYQDRILVKDQTDTTQNGIYWVLSAGTGANGWWSRSPDANQNAFVTGGLTVDVTNGSTNSNKNYRLTTPDPIYLGNTALTFTLVTAAPGGANTYVQFYDQNNQIGGAAGFTFDKTSNAASISGNLTVNGIGNIGNLITANIYSAVSGNINLNLYSSGAGQTYVRQSTGGAYGLNLGQDIVTGGSSSRLFFLGSSGHTAIYNSGGTLFFNTNSTPGTSSGFPQIKISPTGSAVNWLQLTGSATGNAVPITVAGTDGNIDLALSSKGTGNVTVANNIVVGGNVIAQYLFGNGSQIVGLPAGYSNVQVATYLPTYSGNIANIRLGVAGVLTFADGTTQTTASTGGGSYSNVQVATYLATTTSNVLVAGNITIGTVGVVSGAFTTIVGNITQSTSGGGVYFNTSGNIIVNNTAIASSNVTGAIRTTGGIGVGGNIYVGQRVGYVWGANNVSSVYQVFNNSTNSLDTVFG